MRLSVILAVLLIAGCFRYGAEPGEGDARVDGAADLAFDASRDATDSSISDQGLDGSPPPDRSVDTHAPDTQPDGAKPDSAVPDSAVPDSAPPADSTPPTTCSSATGLELCVSFSAVLGKLVQDESGNARDGTMLGTAAVVPGGKLGPGVQMSGAAADSVDFGKLLGSYPQITVMTWVKFNSAPKGWDAVIGRWDTFQGYWLGGSQKPGGFEWWINATVVSTTIATSGWVHLAGTFDQSSKKMLLYVNGVLQATKVQNGAIVAPTAFPLELGHGGTDFVPLDGVIDEVRIWSVARTQPQICSDAGGTPASGGGCTF